MQKIGLNRELKSLISAIIITSLLGWILNLSIFIKQAGAARLLQVKDTITNSAPAVKSNHTIQFVTRSAITSSSTIVIDFDDNFSTTSSPAFLATDATDYDIATGTLLADLTIVANGGCTGSSGLTRFEITTSSNASSFTFTHCNGTDPLAADTTTTIEIGTHATFGGTGDSQILNPLATGSYTVSITAPSADSATTRVAIVDAVTMTAVVATNFTFTVSPVDAGTSINGEATLTSSGATTSSFPFGTLSPGTPKVLGHQLSVSTNARNGFAVTIVQDQNLLSADGSDIDLFDNGTATSTPVAWTSPTATIDDEATYGHYGITSEDTDLNSDEFGTALYAGNISTARTIFSHTGPANGTTANKGRTKIAIKIEISALQEAADDYTNTLTYVATPTF